MTRRSILLAPLAALALIAGGPSSAEAQRITVPVQFKNYTGRTLFNAGAEVTQNPSRSLSPTSTQARFSTIRPGAVGVCPFTLTLAATNQTYLRVTADYYDTNLNKCTMVADM